MLLLLNLYLADAAQTPNGVIWQSPQGNGKKNKKPIQDAIQKKKYPKLINYYKLIEFSFRLFQYVDILF